MKTCTKCGETKTLEEFWNQSSRKDGKSPWCKDCQRTNNAEWKKRNDSRTRDKDRERARKWRRINNSSEQRRRLTYGLRPGEYDDMVEAQNGVCAICGNPPSGKGPTNANLHVDHCHNTGRVRGLLCRSCNAGLGYLHDDPGLLKKAIEYLAT